MKKEGENQRKLSKTEHDREACQALPSSSGKWQLAGKGLHGAFDSFGSDML